MAISRLRLPTVLVVFAAGACLQASSADAGLFKRSPPPAPAASADGVAAIQRALAEDRLADAGKMLDQAFLAGATDLRLQLLSGQLNLARGRYDEALANYKLAEADARLKAQAMEGEGVALSLLGRSDEAFVILQKAVAANPAAWRAWNALGGEYDERQQWGQADAAYERAIDGSQGAAIVLNNRGFSRLLQRRMDEAVKDFVDALRKKPDLAAARTNLRIAMAMRGEYNKAIAGVTPDSEAATLNNAGFAAMLSGDYATAEDLFQRAMNAKGEFYSRASTNLALARELREKTSDVKPAPH
ncbi:MAG TPA: hypothetical protein VGH86_09760 [Phenylobacterium sp.]|jgi:Flp pilus assembly protein TadD